MKMFRKYLAPVKFQVSSTTLFNPDFKEDFKTETTNTEVQWKLWVQEQHTSQAQNFINDNLLC